MSHCLIWREKIFDIYFSIWGSVGTYIPRRHIHNYIHLPIIHIAPKSMLWKLHPFIFLQNQENSNIET